MLSLHEKSNSMTSNNNINKKATEEIPIEELVRKIKRAGEADFNKLAIYKKNSKLLKKLENFIKDKKWGSTQDCRLIVKITSPLIKFLKSKIRNVVEATLNFLCFLSGKTNKNLSAFFEKIFNSEILKTMLFNEKFKIFQEKIYILLTRLLCFNSFEFMIFSILKICNNSPDAESDKYICMSMIKIIFWRYPKNYLKKYIDNFRLISQKFSRVKFQKVKNELFFGVSLLDLNHPDLSKRIVKMFSDGTKKEYLEVRYRVTENLNRRMQRILGETPERIDLINSLLSPSVWDSINSLMKFKKETPKKNIQRGSFRKVIANGNQASKKILTYSDEPIEEYTGKKKKSRRVEDQVSEMYDKERWRRVINQKLEKLKKNKHKKYEPTIDECTEDSKDTSLELKSGVLKKSKKKNFIIPIRSLKFRKLHKMQFRPKSLDPLSRLSKKLVKGNKTPDLMERVPKRELEINSPTLNSLIDFDQPDGKFDKEVVITSTRRISNIVSPIHTENSSDVTKMGIDSFRSISRPIKFITDSEKKGKHGQQKVLDSSGRTTSSSSKFQVNDQNHLTKQKMKNKRKPVKVFGHSKLKRNFSGIEIKPNKSESYNLIIAIIDELYLKKNDYRLEHIKGLLKKNPRKYYPSIKDILFKVLRFFSEDCDLIQRKLGEKLVLALAKSLKFDLIFSCLSLVARSLLQSNTYIENLKSVFKFLLGKTDLDKLDKHVKKSVSMTAKKLSLPVKLTSDSRLSLSSRLDGSRNKSSSYLFDKRPPLNPRQPRRMNKGRAQSSRLNISSFERDSLNSFMSESRNTSRVKQNRQKSTQYRYKKFRDFCVRFSKFCSLSQISKKLDKENNWVKDFEDCSSSSFDTLTMTKVLRKVVLCNLYSKIRDSQEKKRILTILIKFCLRLVNCRHRKIEVGEVEGILEVLKQNFKAI